MSVPYWQRMYGKMPVWAQNAAISLAGLKRRRLKRGGCFREALAFLTKSERWSLAELTDLQNERLRDLIRHAWDTVPYYRTLLSGLGLRPTDFRAVADLDKLPIMDRGTVRSHSSEMLSQGWPKARIVSGHTGGTTGKALKVFEDRDTWAWNWATVWRHRHRFGIKLADSFVTFGGRLGVVPLNEMRPPFWRRNYLDGQTYVSVHHMTVPNMRPLVDYLTGRSVAFYCGYPSALYLVAKYLLENDIRLVDPPRCVITNSETLLPHQARAIQVALGTQMGDLYGQTEHCGIISQCEAGRYHVDMEFGIVELLPVKDAPPNLRRIVCTGLRNPVMPLIRYDTGDLATISSTPCPCGRESPCVERIDGRIESYVVTPDGRQLGRMDHLFKEASGIEEAQFVQHTVHDLTVKLVRGKAYTERAERAFMADLRALVGDAIRITVEPVDDIPRNANGKFRQVISHVAASPGDTPPFEDSHVLRQQAGGRAA